MSRAILRYIRLSPTKARLVAREVQGMNAELALASLEFTPNKAAKLISKVIASAIANGGYDAQDVFVTSCRVDAGPVLRRFMPKAKGRATPIRKPTSHILVEVGMKPHDSRKSKQSEKKILQANVQDTKSIKASKTISNKKSTAKKKTEGEEK